MGRPDRDALGLAGVLAVAAAVRLLALEEQNSHLSADERAYGILALALRHGSYSPGAISEPLHWAPGQPGLLALVSAVAGSGRTPAAVPAAHWVEALLGLASVALVWWIVRRSAGWSWATVAALATALAPGLVLATRRQVSEPLGAFLLVASIAALAWALDRPGGRRLLACGALAGATILTRADLLLVPVLIALVAGVRMGRSGGRSAGLRAAGLVLVATAVVAGPWIAYGSATKGRLVPVSSGGASALFIGTYLPGDGTLYGFKRQLGPIAQRHYRILRNVSPYAIPASRILTAVAPPRPGLSRDAVLSRLTRHNLSTYALGRPLAFEGMLARKLGRLWAGYYRAETRFGATRATELLVWHRLVIAFGILGLLAGLGRRRRDPILLCVFAIVAYSTLDNMLLVAEPRHNVSLTPALLAAGALGWASIARPRRRAAEPAAA